MPSEATTGYPQPKSQLYYLKGPVLELLGQCELGGHSHITSSFEGGGGYLNDDFIFLIKLISK